MREPIVQPYWFNYTFGLVLVRKHVAVVHASDLEIQVVTMTPVLLVSMLRLLLLPRLVLVQNALDLRLDTLISHLQTWTASSLRKYSSNA